MHGLPTKIRRGNRSDLYNTRYKKKHIWAIRNSNSESEYSEHIFNIGHAYKNRGKRETLYKDTTNIKSVNTDYNE
jgi:hypothetical protein